MGKNGGGGMRNRRKCGALGGTTNGLDAIAPPSNYLSKLWRGLDMGEVRWGM